MIRGARAGAWTEGALFALASVLLAQMGLGVFLFLVPIQIAARRRGAVALGTASVLSGIAIPVVALVSAALRGNLEAALGPIVVEIAAVVLLLAGLVVVNLVDGRLLGGLPLGTLPRLLLATAGAGLFSIPLALALRPSSPLGGSIERLFQEAAEAIASIFAQAAGGSAVGGLEVATLAARMRELALEIVPRCYLLYYFVILTFSVWAGGIAAARTTRLPTPRRRLVEFHIPTVYVWPLIGSLALVLADVALDVGALGYAGWNIALVLLFVFGLQGLGIVQFAFVRYSVPRTLRLVVYAVLFVLLLSPSANLLVIIGLPGLGLSEIWLNYRTRRRTSDEGDP